MSAPRNDRVVNDREKVIVSSAGVFARGDAPFVLRSGRREKRHDVKGRGRKFAQGASSFDAGSRLRDVCA